jgi:hypothetical protein
MSSDSIPLGARASGQPAPGGFALGQAGGMQAQPHERDPRDGPDCAGPVAPDREGSVRLEWDPWPGERGRHGGVDEIPLPGSTGRLWLCGKHFVAPDPDTALDAVGADRVVCLCEEGELALRYPAYPAWLRASPRAVWFPVPDLHAPGVGQALPFLCRLRTDLAEGQGLLMHCGAGIGRAGTLAAALLMSFGISRRRALATIRVNRPMAGPEAGAQEGLLVELAAQFVGEPRDGSR